jgi:uncharacterized DUF497 family protein
VEFEWDGAKAESNVAEHGVDFDTAAEIFEDPNRLVIIDRRRVYGERRYQAIAASHGRIFFVAYTIRGKNVYRIISARRATRREREGYALQVWSGPQT